MGCGSSSLPYREDCIVPLKSCYTDAPESSDEGDEEALSSCTLALEEWKCANVPQLDITRNKLFRARLYGCT